MISKKQYQEGAGTLKPVSKVGKGVTSKSKKGERGENVPRQLNSRPCHRDASIKMVKESKVNGRRMCEGGRNIRRKQIQNIRN